MKCYICNRIILLILFFSVYISTANAQPGPEHGLHFDTPSMVWDEAIPLGNGLLGGLVWGDGDPLNISLDRTDLWDLRPVPEFHSEEYSYKLMRQWVKEGKIQDLHRLYDQPYWRPGPTKIPAGRIQLSFGKDNSFKQADLDLSNGQAEVKLGDDISVRVYVHAEKQVGVIGIAGTDEVELNLLEPPFAGEVKVGGQAGIGVTDLAALEYDEPKKYKSENEAAFEQEDYGGFKFAVVARWKKLPGRWFGFWSIATTNDGDNPLEIARRNCTDAMDQNLGTLFKSHKDWWDKFWSKSSVTIPNKIIERQWYLETYKFGSATRSDTPPITLQGPWTADNRKIPPWKGDYHHDLNTELSYWPCYSGNHLDGGQGYVDWLWDTKPNAKAWTKRFFDLPGLNVPMTSDIEQNQIGGWHQYTHSATTAAWLAHHYYLHWRYTMDEQFLKNRAYPWLRDVSVFFEAITEKGPDGKRTLPLSSSPEINDNRLDAWFATITNYDLSLIRWNLATTVEMAKLLGKGDDARRFAAVLDEMPELSLDSETKKLLVAKDYPLKFSHRHFSHLMAIHPLGMIRWENGSKDREIIKASLADLEGLGTSAWCGYSFSWMANMAARARDGETAEKMLEIFSTAFTLRSSFHCNGDQSGKGYSNFKYRPFTLEGNFAAAAGVQEMLIQSYSGVIRLFPAIPESWKDASFKTLRAEGAFLVSADMKGGNVSRVEIFAEKGGLCRIESPFGDKRPTIKGIDPDKMTYEGRDIYIKTSEGDIVILNIT